MPPGIKVAEAGLAAFRPTSATPAGAIKSWSRVVPGLGDGRRLVVSSGMNRSRRMQRSRWIETQKRGKSDLDATRESWDKLVGVMPKGTQVVSESARLHGVAMIGHLAPGVLTNFGHALRAPAGRIHWAGTERATEMHGLMEGAVRSGERAADEVVNAAA